MEFLSCDAGRASATLKERARAVARTAQLDCMVMVGTVVLCVLVWIATNFAMLALALLRAHISLTHISPSHRAVNEYRQKLLAEGPIDEVPELLPEPQ